MNKEEYIEMKKSGQFTLPCFYQYYLDHLHEARNTKEKTWAEFEAAFPIWWEQKASGFAKHNAASKVQSHFGAKFGLVQVNPPIDPLAGMGGYGQQAAYQQATRDAQNAQNENRSNDRGI